MPGRRRQRAAQQGGQPAGPNPALQGRVHLHAEAAGGHQRGHTIGECVLLAVQPVPRAAADVLWRQVRHRADTEEGPGTALDRGQTGGVAGLQCGEEGAGDAVRAEQGGRDSVCVR
uniref:(northern house mosquito) hypothetical protein n=1 Tax=Culex pipiens TaxID=7175 RepID=A0A8D8HZ65_CULPI